MLERFVSNKFKTKSLALIRNFVYSSLIKSGSVMIKISQKLCSYHKFEQNVLTIIILILNLII